MDPDGAVKVSRLRKDAIIKAIRYIEVAYSLYNCIYINHSRESMLTALDKIEIELDKNILVAARSHRESNHETLF